MKSQSFFSFIYNELKPHRRMVIFCVVLAIISALLDTLGPIVMGMGFDFASNHRTPLFYGGAVLGWFVMRLIADWARSFIAHSGGEGIGNRISTSFLTRTAKKIIDKPLEFHYGKKIQEIMERAFTFRWSLSAFLDTGLFDLVPSILAAIAIVIYLFVVSWQIGLIIAVSLVIYIAYSSKYSARLIPARDAWNNADAEFTGTIQDATRNILLVKSTTNEKLIADRVRQKQNVLFDVADRDITLFMDLLNGQNLISATAMAGAIGFGVYALAAGQFTIGRVSAVLAFTFTIFGYIRMIQWQVRMYLRTVSDWQKISTELKTQNENFKTGRAIRIKGGIEFRHVHFRYREDRPALEDINFKIPAGTKVALVGESGEGKTTLIDLMGHYWTPQSGEILIDGIPLSKINLRSLRSQIAYVPQDLTLFHDSLDDNIRFGKPEATDREVRRAVKYADLKDFIAKLPDGLNALVGERGLKLSGGERQRVALARAFLRNPRILILDEPTAHLDSKTEAAIHESLTKLMTGRTVFIIAHRLRTVTDADIILVLNKGRIVETGTHQELAAKPRSVYVSLLKAQGMA